MEKKDWGITAELNDNIWQWLDLAAGTRKDSSVCVCEWVFVVPLSHTLTHILYRIYNGLANYTN
jgi:hypothetical protein